MTETEYFGNWIKVIDMDKLKKTIGIIYGISRHTEICPEYSNIFRAFHACPYNDLKVVILGQDPYPQRGVATGIMFGNNKGTPSEKLSISLKIIKESVINFEVPHNFITFDESLEEWEKQGILLLNSSLTVELGKPGSHTMIWSDFIGSLLKKLSEYNNGLVYLLLGKTAQSFEPYIDSSTNTILKAPHPAYFARIHKKMPSSIFRELEDIVQKKFNYKLKLFDERD